MAESGKEVCRIYRNTKNCRYGAECRFEHSDGEPIAQPPRKLGECYTFRDSGNCDFGEKCRFLHGAADPRVDANGTLKRNLGDEICRNYQRNACRFGDQCRRKHEGPVDASAAPPEAGAGTGGRRRRRPRRASSKKASASTTAAAPAASAPANTAAPANAGNNAANAPAADAPRRRRTRRRGASRAGAPNASASNAAAPAAAPASQNQAQTQNQNQNQQGQAPRRRRRPIRPRGPRIPNDQIVDEQGREVCRTYYHLHRCRFADSCRYIHVAGPNPIQTPAPEARPPRERRAPRAPREPRPPLVCRNFSADGKCDFGDLCRFKHGDADARDMAEVQAKNRARRAQLRAEAQAQGTASN